MAKVKVKDINRRNKYSAQFTAKEAEAFATVANKYLQWAELAERIKYTEEFEKFTKIAYELLLELEAAGYELDWNAE